MADGRAIGAKLSRAVRVATVSSTSSFPLDVFPPWLRTHIESVSHRLQVSADMPAAFGLAVLSTAVARRVRVRAWQGFEQPTALWVVVAAASGENKSAVVNAMRRPVRDYQSLRRKREQADLEEARRRHKLLEKEAEALTKRAVGKGAPQLMADAQAAMRAAEEALPPPEFRLTFDSATTEALVKELALNEFLAHLEGEGDVFTDIVGRYDSGGLLKQYLDAFDGEALDLDRIGRGNVRADRVLLCMGVMLQPDMLAGVMGEGSFKGRGLLERCLYAMPPSMVGRRDVRALEGDRAAEEAYSTHVAELCARFHECEDDRVLTLTAEARAVFVGYRTRIERDLGSKLLSVTSWVSKAQGAFVLRVAGLLAVAWDPAATEVDERVMTLAAKVMEEFFIPQAVKTFGDLRGDAAGHRQRQVEPWIASRKDSTFTPRDLQRARGDLFRDANAARELLERLVEDGRLERATVERSGTTGRKPGVAYRQNRQFRQNATAPRNSQVSERNTEPVEGADLSDSSVLSEGASHAE